MHNLSYAAIYDPDPARICEPPEPEPYANTPEALPWGEEELARIRRVLRKLTALRVDNPEDAEDLVQETLLTMVRKAPGLEIEKGPLIWAMGILRRKVGNYYRRAQRCLPLEDHRQYPLSAVGIPVMGSPEMTLHHAELRSAVDALLLKLTPQERETIDLYLSGLQTGEIVARLRPERYQNIANRLHRGRKKLARELVRLGYRQ